MPLMVMVAQVIVSLLVNIAQGVTFGLGFAIGATLWENRKR